MTNIFLKKCVNQIHYFDPSLFSTKFVKILCFRIACLFVSCYSRQNKRWPALDSATVGKKKKTFPVWPAALRMPTDESKARCGADKEGLMPTSEKKPSDSHRWWFARLAGTQREKTKMAPRRYDNMAALCGDLGTSWGTAAQRRKKGKRKKNTIERKGVWNWEGAPCHLWSRRKECYFVLAKRF